MSCQAPGPCSSGHQTSGSSARSARRTVERRVSRCPFGQHAHHRLAPERQLLEPRILQRRPHEADVDVAGVELLDVHHRVADREVELHVRVALAIGGDDRARDPAGQRARQATAAGARARRCRRRARPSARARRGPGSRATPRAARCPPPSASTPRRLRSNSCTPSSDSSVLICCDTLGCARYSRCAARWKCSSSATATNVRSWRSSMTADDRRGLSQTQALLFAYRREGACTVRHMEGFRPYDIADPFPFYARARAEAPVFFSDELGYWVVSRYDDIQAIFKDPATFSSENTQTPFKPRPPEVQAVFDEAGMSHASAASPAASLPTTRACAASSRRRSRRAGSRRWSRRCARSRSRRSSASRPRPAPTWSPSSPATCRRYVIFRLLGVPDADVPRVKEWALSRVYLNFGDIGVEEQVKHARALVEYWRYCLDLVDRSFEHPGDDLPGDLARIYLEGDRSAHARGDRRASSTRSCSPATRRPRRCSAPGWPSCCRSRGASEALRDDADADPHRRRGAAAARHARLRLEARHQLPGARRRHRPPRGREPAAPARLRQPRRDRLQRPRRDRPPPRQRPQAPRVRPRHPLLPRRRARAARGPGRARGAHPAPPDLRLTPTDPRTTRPTPRSAASSRSHAEWDPAIVPLRDCHDVSLVGGKATGLAALMAAGLPVPDGFAITTSGRDGRDRRRLPRTRRRRPGRRALERDRRGLQRRELRGRARHVPVGGRRGGGPRGGRALPGEPVHRPRRRLPARPRHRPTREMAVVVQRMVRADAAGRRDDAQPRQRRPLRRRDRVRASGSARPSSAAPSPPTASWSTR